MNYENQASVCFNISCPLDVRNREKGCPMWQTCQFYSPEKRTTYAATGTDSTSESGSYTGYDGTGKIRDHSAFKITNINPTNIITDNIEEISNKIQSDLTDKMNSLSSATASSIRDLNANIEKLGSKTENQVQNLKANLDDLRGSTTKQIISLSKCIGGESKTYSDKLHILYNIIFGILQLRPMKFLNTIFRWWAFDIVNEYYLKNGHEYEFHIAIVLRGNMTRSQMNEHTKEFKTRVKNVKKQHNKNHMYDITYIFKPSFQIIK